jgi:hypothetical protein
MSMEASTTATSTEKGLVRGYFEACGTALLEPGKFFRETFSQLPLGSALTFGILSVWLSSFFAFLWDSVNFIFLTSLLDQWMDDIFLNDTAFQYFSVGPKQFLASAGSLLILPFWMLFAILFASMILYFFAKFLTSQHVTVSYVGVIRVLAFASLGSWFVVVPVFGGVLAYIAALLLGIVGLRESFGVSNRRATMMLVMPQIFIVCLLALLATIFLALAFAMPWEIVMEG